MTTHSDNGSATLRNDFDKLREDFQGLAKDLRSIASAKGGAAYERVQSAASDVKDRATKVGETVMAEVKEKPLMSLAIVFFTGLVLGKLLHR